MAFDVVVIGAGVSGLHAASTLANTYGLKVKVLEARSKVGGRIQQDHTFLPGKPVELGAEFIHGDINPVVELCERLGWSRRQNFTWSHGDGGPGEGPAPDGGIGYYWLGKEQRLLRYDDEDLGMRMCNEALWKLSEVEAGTAEADLRSLRQYLSDYGVPEHMIGLADAGYGNTAGGTADTVPATRAMRYERAWHGDGTDLDPDFRMEPSFGVLIEHLAQGLDISTSSPVASVSVDPTLLSASATAMQEYIAAVSAALEEENNADPSSPLKTASTLLPLPSAAQLPPLPAQRAVTVTTKDGSVLRAHRVIVSVPLSVLRDGDITFSPPLSAAKVAAAKSMTFANGVKVGLKFARRAWPANCHGVVCGDSLFPEMWMNSNQGIGGLITGQQCTWPSGASSSVSAAGDVGDEVGSVKSGGVGAVATAPSSSSITSSGNNSTADPASEAPSSSVVYSPEPIPDAEAGVVHTVTGFVMGVRADAMLASFDQSTIMSRMLAQLDAMFGMDATGACISGFVHNWADEEYIRGAYSTPTTWEAVDGSRKLAEPHLNAVFFAGEATAGAVDGADRDTPQHRVHFAPPIVMHGAMQTGGAAACKVAQSLGFRTTCADECSSSWAPTYIPGPTGAVMEGGSTAGKLALAREAGVLDNMDAKLGSTDVVAQIRASQGGDSPITLLQSAMKSSGLVACTLLVKQVEAYKVAGIGVKGKLAEQSL